MNFFSRLFLTMLLAADLSSVLVFAAPRDAQWKKVEEAVQKGLPQTAIQELEPILQAALKENAYGEATKALARRIVLEGNIQGNKPEEKIARLEAEIAKAPKEMTPVLEGILANWYWHYFQNNNWRFMRRTATAQAPGRDFTTWDLPRLFAEIDRHFAAALSSTDTLKRTPISAYDDLLQRGATPDALRPTLYDFLAHEALKFYTAGEQAAAKPQDVFEVLAESPAMASVDQFLAWKIESTDTESPAPKALRLFQELLKFHRADPEPSAFIDADLARLDYAHRIAFGEDKDSRLKAALKSITDKWADHELSALALYHSARQLQQEDNLTEARRLAQRGANAFPESAGGRLSRNLISEIEAPSIQVATERIWNAPWPKIEVRYRNIANLHFRAIAYDWNHFVTKKYGSPDNLDDVERKELLSKTATLNWSAGLPSSSDFKERVENLASPESLKPGFYFIAASPDPSFGSQNGQVTFAGVWVSELALIVRPRNGAIEGFVLEANSGEPVSGAEVQAWTMDNQGNRTELPSKRSDADGFFELLGNPQRPHLLRVRHNGRELGAQHDYSAYRPEPPRPSEQTVFFTDRAIYRPGQTIQYKGICLRVDPNQDNYAVIERRDLTVVFADANGKEIARQPHRTGDYGSFAGSFIAPRDRLMGSMRISVSPGPAGSSHFNVEEYKRPKFQVSLDAPNAAAKLNESVALTGHALSYTGAAVDGAVVKYRVVRDVRMPYWWSWHSRRGPRSQASQEITHGTTKTATDGSFKVEFLAKPDLAVPEKDEPTFTFQIYADVTDNAGETRSAQRSIHAGYTALQAAVSADEWQTEDKPVELKIRTTTLDGEGQSAEGTLKIYRLNEPMKTVRPPLGGGNSGWAGSETERSEDLSNANNWPIGALAAELGFATDAAGETVKPFKLGAGLYRAMLETRDRFGKKVTARQPIQVLRPSDTKLAIKLPHLLAAPDWTLEPGHEFMALWGTGYDAGRAFIEIEHRNKMLQRFWTKPGQTQQQIKQAVTEAMRGGFTLHVTQVRENRAYLDSRHINVPWINKELDIQWEHFTSKLEPNQKETWTAVIKPRTGAGAKLRTERDNDQGTKNQPRSAEVPLQGAERAVAEMVAALYDESLDAFMQPHWPHQFSVFRHDYSTASPAFENVTKPFQWLQGQWPQRFVPVELTYRSFPQELTANVWLGRGGGMAPRTMMRSLSEASTATASDASALVAFASPPPPGSATPLAMLQSKRGDRTDSGEPVAGASSKSPDLNQVTARKNLNETAFFFPQLVSDTNGVVRMQFTMPEALTQWRFLGFAHDRQLRSGFLEGRTVTAKDLMVQPNPPRFVREGDELEFTVKVFNQTAARQTGKVRLTFNQLSDSQPADKLLGISKQEVAFDIPSKESRSYAWRIKVPDGLGMLSYKAVGSTGRVSDGEEGFLPVLPRRVFVTESLPLSIRGPGTNKFEFASLLKSGKSGTLRHQALTVQMVSNPAWYAVMALPFLMEYPHECSEQTFNRLYANSLARHIASSDPKIRKVFDQWIATPALDSPLEKNADLKSVMIEETPWLRQAQSESQARKNAGILFDDNRLNDETSRALQKLAEMQLPDGSWPWFPGGRGNDFITLYITTGFGRLRHLGVDAKIEPALRALNRLDGWIDETYRAIVKRADNQTNHLTETIALYLYGRSFFLKDRPIAAPQKEAVDFFLSQARLHWLKLASRQSQGHLALALKRFNAMNSFNDPTPPAILASLKERSVANEEMGRHWRDTELSWWWHRAPIETQALMIEAFDEVAGDAGVVEECKVWLLKQKQTQDWKTTKATADAAYALLLRGRDLLASDALVEVTLGTSKPKVGMRKPASLDPRRDSKGNQSLLTPAATAPEPGMGFYERRYAPGEITPKLGAITVRKVDAGVAWGGVHWQYLEDMNKLRNYEGTPLKVTKTLFTKVTTKKGPVLEPVKGPLQVGDELVVRVELRVDRDMEYAHLKDQRGSGVEPMQVLSRYKFQDGLAYYESTRDTATHFFIDYLPKGVYVFEYSTRVTHKGTYQSGIAEIQCLYAPEFNSHSQSFALTVR